MTTKKITNITEEKVSKITEPSSSKVTKKQNKTETPVLGSVEKNAVKAKTNIAKTEKKENSLLVSVYDLDGKEIETINLPEEVFGAKVNPVLMAQAVRVYLANQRQGNASTKTRGEVTGSTRKIYRQKGTGRARHGGVRAPIFVHGGIAHGPKPKDYSLSMPKKMRRAALFSALSAKLIDGNVKVISGLETIEPKTKIIAHSLTSFGLADQKPKVMLVLAGNNEVIMRAGRNLEGVTITAFDRLNTYEVINTKSLVLMKDVIEKIQEVFLKGK